MRSQPRGLAACPRLARAVHGRRRGLPALDGSRLCRVDHLDGRKVVGMRYPTVLFDFDGTLIDSGEIILASFRHATKTVLEQEIPDEVLAAAVGGSNIYEQMRTFDKDRADELVRVYREHNEPLHDDLVAFEGVERVLALLKEEGRQLGIVTA